MNSSVVQRGIPTPFSEEWHVAVAPERTYSALVEAGAPHRLFSRLGLILLLFATVASLILTRRITVGLIATAALTWSFVLVLQIVVGVLVIATAPARRVGMARALDLWFASHLPYSLWLLVIASWILAVETFPPFPLVVSILVPAAWTAFISRAYGRVVLGLPTRSAHWRVALHQSMAWLCVITYLVFASGGPMSLAIYLTRQFGLRG
jgi:hypothetical protein